MKKVGILTINDNNNYGNRLQNYAVQELIKKQGLTVETIINNTNFYFSKQKLPKRLALKVKIVIKNFFEYRQRKKCFAEFNKNITFNKSVINSNKNISYLNREYDFFITGSDQVWNPRFNRMSHIDFLYFAPPEKRIAFAPSIGLERLEESEKELFKKYLPLFKKISVREEEGKRILAEFIPEKQIEVLIDPTLALDIDNWKKIMKKPVNFDSIKGKKYIFNFFLGKDKQLYKEEIERLAQKEKCIIVDLMNKNDIFFNSGPSEFIYLISNSYVVCTDSYHASIFSFLYNRPFIVFDRDFKGNNMGSRINTLINKFNLKDRKFNGSKITKENLENDYTDAYKILEEERKKSERFLKKALDIEE